jgi:hypothetical protein
MSTPAATIPPTVATVEIYRVAVLAYRKSFAEEVRLHGFKKADKRVPLRVARNAVMAFRPEMGPDESERLAHQATAWTAQAHNDWFWAPVRAAEDD